VVPPSSVVFTSAACQARRRRTQGAAAAAAAANFDPTTGLITTGSGGGAVTVGMGMVLSLTLTNVVEFTTMATDFVYSGTLPPASPGDYFLGGPPDPFVAGQPIPLAIYALSAQLLVQAVGTAMGCGVGGSGGVPGAGVSAQPLEPFGPFFTAFSAATGLSPENGLSCAAGALRVSIITPPAPAAAAAPPLVNTSDVIIASVLAPVGAVALGAAVLVLLRARAQPPGPPRRGSGSPKRSARRLPLSSLPSTTTFGERRPQATPAVVVFTPAAMAAAPSGGDAALRSGAGPTLRLPKQPNERLTPASPAALVPSEAVFDALPNPLAPLGVAAPSTLRGAGGGSGAAAAAAGPVAPSLHSPFVRRAAFSPQLPGPAASYARVRDRPPPVGLLALPPDDL
jgi:hypothetical protein